MLDKALKESRNKWTHLYKKGFYHVANFVDQVEEIAPESGNIMIEALDEINRRILLEVRAERVVLEEDLKRFLAATNGKLSYLKSLELQLVEWDHHINKT